MAVPGKRLFWISIIIVELVFVYVLWRPVRDRLTPSRRTAVTSPTPRSPESLRLPESKAAPIVLPPPKLSTAPSSKPWAGAHPAVQHRTRSVVINAGLKTVIVVPPPSGPMESFWCHISMAQPPCDCKAKDTNQTANLVQQ
jgi:hypothetical protein